MVPKDQYPNGTPWAEYRYHETNTREAPSDLIESFVKELIRSLDLVRCAKRRGKNGNGDNDFCDGSATFSDDIPAFFRYESRESSLP
jgi:hypothetical protein